MMVREWLMTLDSYTNETYGRPVSSAILAGTCVACEGTNRPFSTPAGARVYSQQGLCERCQAAHGWRTDNIVPFDNYRTLSG